MKNSKPNIFRLATKELSQDSFFAWLLQWADNSHNQYNPELNETAKDFVRLLIGQSQDYQIAKVEAGRQWHNIDVWAEINDEYFLGIEDKTNTVEHSEQLERYKQIATEHYKNKNYKLTFVYLKTGNESSLTLKKIIDKGYLVIGRKAVLNILNKRQIQNEIINDFKEYLTTIEDLTNSYNKFENITTEWKAAEGFYIKLQELIPEWTDWRYVPNQTGGFLGFYYHWKWFGEGNLYIQMENAFDYGIKLVIKIDEWEQNISTLYQILSDLQPYANKYGLTITKPDKYRVGETSTLAIIQNAFSDDSNGDINLDRFLVTLKNLENILSDYSADKSFTGASLPKDGL
jgi:hypothetical protein